MQCSRCGLYTNNVTNGLRIKQKKQELCVFVVVFTSLPDVSCVAADLNISTGAYSESVEDLTCSCRSSNDGCWRLSHWVHTPADVSGCAEGGGHAPAGFHLWKRRDTVSEQKQLWCKLFNATMIPIGNESGFTHSEKRKESDRTFICSICSDLWLSELVFILCSVWRCVQAVWSLLLIEIRKQL